MVHCSTLVSISPRFAQLCHALFKLGCSQCMNRSQPFGNHHLMCICYILTGQKLNAYEQQCVPGVLPCPSSKLECLNMRVAVQHFMIMYAKSFSSSPLSYSLYTKYVNEAKSTCVHVFIAAQVTQGIPLLYTTFIWFCSHLAVFNNVYSHLMKLVRG